MTNILILNAGTRVKLVEYFKALPDLKVVCTDASLCAPALFSGDRYYQMPYITDPTYVDRVLEVCELEQIDGVLSLIDPAIFLLSQQRQRFEEKRIVFVAPPTPAVDLCFDKRKMYKFCRDHHLPTVPTYSNLADFEHDYQQGKVNFPVFIKPATGSASMKIQKVEQLAELQAALSGQHEMIIQPFMTGTEYGVDAYCDLETGELIECFVKEKLLMRSGETDKARSADPNPVLPILKALVKAADLRGPIDVDFFYEQGEWLISEVNPRFGGGYPFAQACGMNSPKWIVNNVEHQSNQRQTNNYPLNMVLMKYPEIVMLSQADIASHQAISGVLDAG
ncbi:ATP-grasp domain-containing protein [Lapidilactobacillus dextrinicus]|nr:ATP-grasp domain-containing protein [Lapidilactobacillus dextrinicus]